VGTVLSQRQFDELPSDHARAKCKQEVKVRAKKTATGANKKDISAKKHFRWLTLESNLLAKHIKLNAGEVAFDVIFNEEMIKSLLKLDPTLDTKDTNQRHKFNPLRESLRELAGTIGRVAEINNKQIIAELKSEFAEDWNQKWSEWRQEREAIAVPKEAEEALRNKIATEIDALAPQVWVSIRG
jgi:hypothetical protein